VELARDENNRGDCNYLRLGHSATTLSGGDRGGSVVAVGTPEAVAQVEGSHTGRYLRQVLE
jgi:excinuclease UvrABC ATPase subunit